MKDWVVIGKFGRPVGIRGEIRLFSYSDPVDKIANYKPFYIKEHGDFVPVEVEFVRQKNEFFCVTAHGVESRSDASALTNKELYVERDTLPALPDDEFYWYDLLSYTVKTNEGNVLGEVKEVVFNGAQDVLLVGDKKAIMIPFVWDVFILSVDESKKEIIVCADRLDI